MTTTTKQQDSGHVSAEAHARDAEFLSDRQRLRLCEMAEAGASVRDIAAELRVSPSSVSRYAKRLGVSFDRSKTDAATAAKIADGRARRTELAARLLALADGELDRLSRPHRAFSFLSGQAPGYYEQILPQPDPASRLAIVRTAMTLLQQHTRLAEFDGDQTMDDAKSMLGNIQMNLHRVAAELDAQEADRGEA